MHIGIIQDLLSDPRGTLIVLLLALPGRMLAICAHEAAHGWMAERCGDPTARMMGRVTLNPMKHLDPIGVICFMLLGIGWARPVPVNPRNFRNGRRDDLKVSLAGICMNLILFLVGALAMYLIVGLLIAGLPRYDGTQGLTELFRYNASGTPAVNVGASMLYSLKSLMQGVTGLSDLMIVPAYGRLAGWLYQMLVYFTTTNLMLAAFNLIPLPPLDGYHVLNDLLLKRSFFATAQAARVCMAVLYIGIFTGVVSRLLSYVYVGVFSLLGSGMTALLVGMGLF